LVKGKGKKYTIGKNRKKAAVTKVDKSKNSKGQPVRRAAPKYKKRTTKRKLPGV